MRFVLNYNKGYEVGVIMWNDYGRYGTYPLRNFSDRQGDAMIFKMVDCPKLNDYQIRTLIKNYNPDVKYIRVSGTQFKKQEL